jgi:S1-C subfamily serine protease
MVAEIVAAIDEADARPTYKSTGRQTANRDGDRPYFGSIPDFGEPTDGFAISGVTKGGPAEKGGLRGGDVITSLGDNKIANLEDFDAALRKFEAGDKVKVGVRRGKETLDLEVTLEEPR